MPTNPYSLVNSYTNNSKVSASDLNRRANIAAFQLPGALIASGLDAGVLPLIQFEGDSYQNALQTAQSWATASQAALKITAGGGIWTAAPGAALVRHPSGHLVWTTAQNGLSINIQAPDGGELYIHLLLAIPDNETDFGALDSQIGTPPSLFVSELEVEPGALILASWDGSVLVDRRAFIAPAALAVALQGLVTRVEALENASGGGEGGESVSWLSQLLYNITNPVQADTYIDARFEELKALITEVQGGPKKFPDELSLLADATAGIGVGLFEVNPPAMLRVQMAALGRGFGKGQNSTPDVSPDTGEANEANYDFATGLITP